IDRIAGLMKTSNGRRRDARARNHRSVSQNVLVLSDFTSLIVTAFAEVNHSLLNVGYDVDDWDHGVLPVPHALHVPGVGAPKVYLSFYDVELQLSPMAVAARNKLSGHPAELLERHAVVLHQDGDRPQTNNVLKRVHAAIRIEAVFVGVSRGKKILSIPAPK